ncbi:MAG: aminoacyl-tRNA hydrolase [Dehalococcoidia bacterium]|nr:aminoacyl-tRNA hydrolase [Dehalococcoidia bacterium]
MPSRIFRSFLAGRRRAHRLRPVDDETAAGTWLIMGLGNPGRDYAHNRHNVGFWCVNRLARSYNVALDNRTSLATVGQGHIEGRDAALAKPRTFVNNSGEAAAALVRRFRILPGHLLVICDSLDLPVGVVRVRARGSHGGHKGLKSITQKLGVDAFPRIRVGIGRPLVAGESSYDPEVIADYVLSDPPPDERRALDAATETVIAAVACIMEQGVEAAMNRFNRERRPKEPG